MADLLEQELLGGHYEHDNFDDRYADEMDMLREMDHETGENPLPSSVRVVRPESVTTTSEEFTTELGDASALQQDVTARSRSTSPLPLCIYNDQDQSCSENLHASSHEDLPTSSQPNPLRDNPSDEEQHMHRDNSHTGLDDKSGKSPINSSKEQPWTDDFPARTSAVSTGTSSSIESLLRKGRVYTRVPPGPHIALTGAGGKRVYLKVCPEDALTVSAKKMQGKNCRLLAMPFQHLRQQVDEMRLRQAVAEQDTQQGTENRHSKADSHDVMDSGRQEGAKRGKKKPEQRTEQVLWVEKYSPLHFTELLSDDGTNRTILSWLKLWDKVVFGKSAISAVPKKPTQGKPVDNRFQHGKKQFPSKFEYFDPKTFSGPEALDPTGRPKLKIVLLCGPPGLGKTTLAHIIAKHAGYNVIEMNASDDRSPEVFRQRISSSTQMQNVLNGDTRPNCLIIDEIDGAPQPSIAILLELVKRKKPTAIEGGKKKGKDLMSRPIICICNDQYVPSLRELRQHALVMEFPPTIQSRLSQRLVEVCKKERLRASVPALSALCEKAENDIRSCLNTLQFLRRRRSEITVSVVQNASIGQKDSQKNLFMLWKDIFQLPSVKKQSLVLRRSQNEISKSDRFLYILYNVSSVGMGGKVLQGVFENYPNMKYRDPSLRLTCDVMGWMVFQDLVDQRMMSTQNYSLMAYLPFASVAAHIYLASPSTAKVHYPRQQFEVAQSIQRSTNIAESLMTDMPPRTRNFITRRNLTVEILPLLLETLAPTLRPVSVQLYSSKEKQLLSNLVATMISFNVNYHQEKNIDGQYEYRLEPNLNLLVRFPGLLQRRQLTYAAKQLIAREVDLEKMRRAEQILHKDDDSSFSTPKARKDSTASAGPSLLHGSTPKRPPVSVMEMVQSERTPARLRKRKAAMEFFTRSSGNNQKKRKEEAMGESKSGSIRHPLWFRYNEGFLNAVRRPVKLQDLL